MTERGKIFIFGDSRVSRQASGRDQKQGESSCAGSGTHFISFFVLKSLKSWCRGFSSPFSDCCRAGWGQAGARLSGGPAGV
jgi:hypothetical protein